MNRESCKKCHEIDIDLALLLVSANLILNLWRQCTKLIETKVNILDFLEPTLKLTVERRYDVDERAGFPTGQIDSQPEVNTFIGLDLIANRIDSGPLD